MIGNDPLEAAVNTAMVEVLDREYEEAEAYFWRIRKAKHLEYEEHRGRYLRAREKALVKGPEANRKKPPVSLPVKA